MDRNAGPDDLFLVRHGETVARSSRFMVSRGDVALSALGLRQAERVRDALAHVPFEAVFSSTMDRARETAAVVSRRVARAIGDLDEVRFGEWEGLDREEIRRRSPALVGPWISGDPSFAYPGGESRAGFRVRVLRGLERVLEAPRRGPRLLVAHKGVIRVAIGALLGPDTSRPLSLDLGSISWLRLRDGGAAQAVALDRVDHLGDDRVEEE